MKRSYSKLLLFGSLISAILSFNFGTKLALLSVLFLLVNVILLQSKTNKKLINVICCL